MLKYFFLLAASLVMLPQVADAGVVRFMVDIDGAQAGTTSTGTGSAVVDLDDVSGLLSITGSFSGLDGNSTVAHLHGFTASPASGNAGVLIGLNFINGSSAASFTGTGTIANPTDIQLVKDGHTYINIHSSTNPSGEIRGFLVDATAVPEPGSVAALAILGAVVVARRRKR